MAKQRITYTIGAQSYAGRVWDADGDRLLVDRDGTSDVFTISQSGNHAQPVASPVDPPVTSPVDPAPVTPPAGVSIWRGDGTQPINEQWAEISTTNQPGGACATNSSRLVLPDNRIQIITSDVPPGLTHAYEITVQDGDNAYGERAELGQGNPTRSDWDGSADDGTSKPTSLNPHLFYEGDEYWIGVQIKLVSPFPIPSWQAMLQIKHLNDGNGGPCTLECAKVGGPNWGFCASNSNDYNSNDSLTTREWQAPPVLDVWAKFLLGLHFSPDKAVGWYELWADVNGSGVTNVVPRKHNYTMCFYKDGTLLPSHARMGIYRNPSVTGTSRARFAGYNVATTRELAASIAGITL